MYDLSHQNSLKLQSTAETYLEFSNTDELVEISKNYGLEQGNFCVIGEGTNSIFPISFKNIVLKAMGKDIKKSLIAIKIFLLKFLQDWNGTT